MRFLLLVLLITSTILFWSADSLPSQPLDSNVASVANEPELASSIESYEVLERSKQGDFSMPDDAFYDAYEQKVTQWTPKQDRQILSEDIQLLSYRLGGDENLQEYVEMTRDILPSIEADLSDLQGRKEEMCFDHPEICRVVENIKRTEAKIERLRDRLQISADPGLQSDLYSSLSAELASFEAESLYLDHLQLDQVIDRIVVQKIEGLVSTQVDYEAVIDRYYATASL